MAPDDMLNPVADLDVGCMVRVWDTQDRSIRLISMTCFLLCCSAVRVHVSYAYRNTPDDKHRTCVRIPLRERKK